MEQSTSRVWRWRDRYALFTIAFTNLALFLLLFNFLLWAVFTLRDRDKPSPMEERYGDLLEVDANLEALYPDLTPTEARAMLREGWGRRYEYEAVTQWRERAVEGQYFNVHAEGFRLVPDQGPWPPDPGARNVFVFGGSTTFGYSVPDGETLPAKLQALLRSRGDADVFVYNFGRGDYFSTVERLLFEKLIFEQTAPDVAIFVDGLNDFVYHPSWIRDLLFTDRIAALFDVERTVGMNLRDLMHDMPMARLARRIRYRLRNLLEPRSEVESEMGEPEDVQSIVEATLDRYERNRRLISSVAREHGIEVLFVWQPIHLYGYDLEHHLFANVNANAEVYRYTAPGYAELARRIEAGLPAPPLWCADIQRGVAEPLYVDLTHYSGAMAARFAECIAQRD